MFKCGISCTRYGLYQRDRKLKNTQDYCEIKKDKRTTNSIQNTMQKHKE